MFMYNRELVVPIDVKYSSHRNGNSDGNQQVFGFVTFDVVFSLVTKARRSIINGISRNIKNLRKTKVRF